MASTATLSNKTNERPGTRAQHRYARMSAYKAREVLDLIRGLPVERADETLQFTERAAAVPVRKLLASAVANAEHNDQLDGDTLYVAACYADEGPTLKRWRPRARGRATRIRKRTCHITIVVAAMPPEMLARFEADRAETGRGRRSRRGRAAEARRARVARSRGETVDETPEPDDEVEAEDVEETTAAGATPAGAAEAPDTDETETAAGDTETEDEEGADAAEDTDDSDQAEEEPKP
jgi:large subunit ribosomal protein L22